MYKFNWVKLADCCQVVTGATPRRNQPRYWNGDIPWVTPKDLSKLNGQYIYSTPECITREGYNSCPTTILPTGSILLSSRAPIGLLAITGVEMCTNQGFKSLIPTEAIDSHYLFWCMKKHMPQLAHQGTGTTFKEVSKKIVENFEIPLPPIAQQKRIAAILDKADAVRRKRREAIRLTEELLRSTFLEMFGDPITNPNRWEYIPLGELISIRSGQVDPKKPPYLDMLHVGGENIESITGDIINCQTPRELNLISGKYLFQPGDILYSKIRPYLNKVALPAFHGLCSADIYPITVNSSVISPLYLVYILRSKSFLDYTEKYSSRTNIPKINRQALTNFQCLVPPLEKQDKFSKIFQVFSIKKNHLSVCYKQLDDLFHSLLQRAFTGDL